MAWRGPGRGEALGQTVNGMVRVGFDVDNPIGDDVAITATSQYLVDWGDGTKATNRRHAPAPRHPGPSRAQQLTWPSPGDEQPGHWEAHAAWWQEGFTGAPAPRDPQAACRLGRLSGPCGC